jgi:hypothetical protein
MSASGCIKQLLAYHIIISVPLGVSLAILSAWVPATRVYAGLWGIAATLTDLLWLAPWQQSLREQAAKIQELFDCDVLHLPWNETAAGSPPAAEAIAEWSSLPQGITLESLKLTDWYAPVVGSLPLHLARLVCQRTNCWWDATLRRRYAAWTIGIVGTIYGALLVVGIARAVPADRLALAGILPLAPLTILAVRQFREHRDAAERVDSLRHYVENLWTQLLSGALTPEASLQTARRLQDRIFDHRRRSPLIFDRIYGTLRPKQETTMHRTADELLDEVRISNDQHVTTRASRLDCCR